MIDVRTAVTAAYNYIKSLQDVIDSPLPDLRLEEVELSDDDKFWLITLGFDATEKNQSGILNYVRRSERIYKLFKVNSNTGQVEAMKIREV
ncbi:hypothetical protein [Anabaena azotica]|uniref:hypothetical protein n=1 Tax=Anabaena azotica TaxID=197653 RepID=UPI0039A44FF6